LPFNTAEKKTKGGILPNTVSRLGFTFERPLSKGESVFSTSCFFVLSMDKTHYKVDLHSHSIISHDGGITAEQYERILSTGMLDCIAITDHNETSFARIMHKKHGDKIIIGEEITTKDGEIIGLYLQETIPPKLSAVETVRQIREQNGLVYIPHPFEIFRKGLHQSALDAIVDEIDIVEIFNGRGQVRGKPKEAASFANLYEKSIAASSDAHTVHGMGRTFSSVSEFPTHKSLKRLLARPTLSKRHAPLYTLLYPSINRIKNKILLTNG
jgi:predicted metal-dependent phosphoesterase TrpH